MSEETYDKRPLIKIKRIKYQLSRGGVCVTKDMTRKLREPPETFVEVTSLLEWMRWARNIYFQDETECNESIKEFIGIVHGTIVELADERDLEWE